MSPEPPSPSGRWVVSQHLRRVQYSLLSSNQEDLIRKWLKIKNANLGRINGSVDLFCQYIFIEHLCSRLRRPRFGS